jgi:hypothetical protein
MKTTLVKILIALLLCAAPLLGARVLRARAHEIYDSSARMGQVNGLVEVLMGPRTSASEVELQKMEPIDQYWFAFENRDVETLKQIAKSMAEGEDRIGARAVACMSGVARSRLEEPDMDPNDISVCLAAGGATEVNPEVPLCTDAGWSLQAEKLVLISVFGQDTHLDRTDMIKSCRSTAQHWRQWSNRR